jgi:hypothetical protein
MAHAGCGGARLAIVEQNHFLPAFRQLPRAGGADDPGADHDDIAVVHTIPQQKGSSGLRISRVSPQPRLRRGSSE